MFVIPVEKKGKYAHSLSLRFLCYDPATRMAYLSDKDSKVRQWKHRMKVYAIMPACVQGSEPINFRVWNYEAKDVLTFTISGISYHRLDRSNAADQIELQRLPHLLNESYQDSAPSIRTYAEGKEMQQPSQQPVSLTDDANFFGKDRDDWVLRCPYYNAAHDMIMLMRDTLIADGLRYPIYGGLRGGLDPRNGLHLASFPLYLQQNFRQLAGAVVYSCVHGRMIGCDPHGNVGVCMRHVYLCITDQDVLFVAESGSVARSVPLTYLQKVEYNGPAGTSNPSSGTPSPTPPGPHGSSSVPYIAFLAGGDAADVLFSPCSAFPVESEDCSASMAAAMPRMNVAKEVEAVTHILATLLSAQKGGSGGGGGAASASTKARKEATADIDPDVHLDSDATAANAPADPASLPSSFSVVALNSEQTVQDYAESFHTRHGRAFKWQPLPGARLMAPTVQSAASVAQSLRMAPMPRQTITRRSEFLPFYYGSAAAARAAEEMAVAAREERRETAARRDGGDDLYAENVYAPTVPVRRVSKIIDMFKPEPNVF